MSYTPPNFCKNELDPPKLLIISQDNKEKKVHLKVNISLSLKHLSHKLNKFSASLLKPGIKCKIQKQNGQIKKYFENPHLHFVKKIKTQF